MSKVICTKKSHVHWFGHSWVAGQAGGPGRGPITESPGGFHDAFRAIPAVPSLVVPTWGAPTLASAKTDNIVPAPVTGRPDNVTYYGIGGASSATYLVPANYQKCFKNFQPDICIFMSGVNDIGTDPTVFTNNTNTLFAQMKADRPTCQFIVCGVTPKAEQYTVSPNHFSDGLDTAPVTVAMQTCAATAGFIFADVTTFCLNLEIANNTPAPGAVTFYSYDDLHWLEPGKTLIGQWLIQNFFTFV